MVRVLSSASALSLLGSVEVFGEMDDNVVAVGRADHPPNGGVDRQFVRTVAEGP